MDPSAVSTPGPEPAPPSVSDAPTEPAPVQTVPYEEELPAARQVYQAAKTVIEAAMHDARMGRDPLGSIVQMNTGELAVVRRLHHEAPLEPIVFLVKGPGQTLLSRPEEVDLHQQTGRPYRNIALAKEPEAAGLNPSAYLDRECV